MAAVKDAGLTQIDHLITTHWHGDHFGGMAELASRIPIRHFIDHGPNVQPQPAVRRVSREDVYPGLLRQGEAHGREAGRHVPIAGLDWRIVSSAGKAIKTRAARRRRRESVLRRLQAAGCRPDRERAIGRQRDHVRPLSRGASRRSDVEQGVRADVPGQSDRHGRSVRRVASRAGDLERRGARARAAAARRDHEQRHAQGRPAATRCRSCTRRRGLQDLWQMHFSLLSGQEYTVPGLFIANADRRPTGRDADRAVPRTSGRRRRRRRPYTTAPPTGSRCRRRPTARSR